MYNFYKQDGYLKPFTMDCKSFRWTCIHLVNEISSAMKGQINENSRASNIYK